jgi:integrase
VDYTCLRADPQRPGAHPGQGGQQFVTAHAAGQDSNDLARQDRAGLGTDWQPRETLHSFASIASASGVSIEDIADAMGHVNANVTRAVYRHQISDTVTRAPAAMDRALAAGGEQT